MRKNNLIAYIFLIMATTLTVGPFVWMVLTSLKTLSESIMVPPVIFPENPGLSAYFRVFTQLPFFNFYINSIIATLIIVTAQVLISSMAAYGFARIKFKGRDFVFMACMAVLMVPGQIFLIPQFLIIHKLGLVNTLTGLVLPGLFSIYGGFLLRQFFSEIPQELEDAAVVDGLNHFQIYWQIMFPLIRPGVMAFIIITGLSSWNSLLWPLIVNTSMDKMTLPVGLASLSARGGADYPMLMAGSVVAIIPMLLLFIAFQKKFIQGIATTGVKG